MWLTLRGSNIERFKLNYMKIARKGLCDVLLHCTKRLSSISQGSQVTWEESPSHGRAIGFYGGMWQGSETAKFFQLLLQNQDRMLKMRQLDGPESVVGQ